MKNLLACVAILCLAGVVRAADVPFQASLTPDIAIYAMQQPVSGVTLSIWGQNPQHALALGLVNGSTDNSGGLSLGLANYASDYIGVQWGIVNVASHRFVGWQKGAVNYVVGECKGFQLGLINYAGQLNGFQLGVLNVADDAKAGLQVGLVNAIETNKQWFGGMPDALAPAMILANWRF